jgi:hypothetical protein
MGTGTNTSGLQFNPLAQSTYNNLVGGAGGVLGGYINSPFGNPSYTLGAAQSAQGAQQAGGNNMAALMQNMLTSGMGGQAGAGFKQAQLAQTGRANQALTSQSKIQNVLGALQRQMSAAGTGLSFSPQLTGQSGSFKSQNFPSGLGTWLPQVLSGAAGIGLAGATGGASLGLTAGAMAGDSSNGSGGLSFMNPSTWGGITGSSMPGGMAGVNPNLMGGMAPGALSSGAPNPFLSIMGPQTPQ